MAELVEPEETIWTSPVVRERRRVFGRRVRVRCPDCGGPLSLQAVVCVGCGKRVMWVEPGAGD